MIKRLLALLLCIALSAHAGTIHINGPTIPATGTPFIQGINFSATGYASGNNDSEIAGSTYPRTSAQGNTVGWESTVSGHGDRDTGLDERFRGVAVNGSITDYRIDLPSTGDYRIGISCGDSSFGGDVYVELFDTSSSLGVLCNQTGLTSSQFVDATNTIRSSSSDWITNQVLVTKTFTTTILRFRHGNGGITAKLTHIYVEKI